MTNSTTKRVTDASASRVKILVTYRGKLQGSSPNGKLYWFGGKSIILPFERSVSFSELSRKLEGLCESKVNLIRFKLPTEDLDALVDTENEEDLQNVMEEYDFANRERAHPLMIRAFFSPKKLEYVPPPVELSSATDPLLHPSVPSAKNPTTSSLIQPIPDGPMIAGQKRSSTSAKSSPLSRPGVEAKRGRLGSGDDDDCPPSKLLAQGSALRKNSTRKTKMDGRDAAEAGVLKDGDAAH